MPTTNQNCMPTGDLTIFEAVAFKDALVTLLSQEGPVVLDLAQVNRVDTSALQLILAAQRSGRLHVTGAPDTVKRNMARIGCPGSLAS